MSTREYPLNLRFVVHETRRSNQTARIACRQIRTRRGWADANGQTCPYGPMPPVLQPMPTELRGAEREIGFIDVILRDEVCAIGMASLAGADMPSLQPHES